MKLGTELKATMSNLLGLIYSEKPLDTFEHSRCKTEGWAEQVVNQWEMNSSQMPKQKKVEESRISALRFFGRQKFVRTVLNARPLTHKSTEEDKSERLHFYRPANSDVREKQVSSRANDLETPCHDPRKRRLQSETCDTSHESPLGKRSSSLTLTAEDIDLLNSY